MDGRRLLMLHLAVLVLACALAVMGSEVPRAGSLEEIRWRGGTRSLKVEIEDKIVGGTDAPCGRFPYMASLQTLSGDHQCGGALVDKEWVLTAAHCVANTSVLYPSHVVFLGLCTRADTKGTEDSGRIVEIFPSKKIVVHPDYTGNSGEGNDIALVKLDGKSENMPVNLATNAGELANTLNVAAIGFGISDDGKPADTLQFTNELSILPNSFCNSLWDGIIQDSMVCAFGKEAIVDTCPGDSGGPLLVPFQPEGKIENGDPDIDKVVGITSFGEKKACGKSAVPAVYTRVTSYVDWIESVLEEEASEEAEEEPEGPEEPIAPGEPVEVDSPVEVEEPAEVEETTEPRQPAEPEEPAEPAEPAEPDEPGEPAEAEVREEPTESKEPAEAEVREEPVTSEEPPAPEEPEEPRAPEEPEEPTAPEEPEEPKEPEMSGENAEPEPPAEPEEPEGPPQETTEASPGCACSEDGVSAGVETGFGGCTRRLEAGAALCYVRSSEGACSIARDSVLFPGALWISCTNQGDEESVVVKELLKDDARDTAQLNKALKEAVSSGRDGDARDALLAGADPDFTEHIVSVLRIAADHGFVAVGTALMESGADIDSQDDQGSTALHTAAEWGHVDFVAMLVAAGADVTARDSDGKTARGRTCDLQLEDCARSEIKALLEVP